MRRAAALGLAALAGVFAGASLVLLLQRPAAVDPPSLPAAPAASPVPSAPAVQATPSPPRLARPRAADVAGADVLLAWTAGGLPDGVAGRLADLSAVRRHTIVRADLVQLAGSWDAGGRRVDAPRRGFVIPLDVMAFDAKTYSRFVPAGDVATFRRLGPREALLGATSARLRRIGAGGRLRLAGGETLTVAAVVDDALVGAAEAAVTVRGGRRIGVTTRRYALLQHSSPRVRVERAVRRLLPRQVPVRLRGPGETPWFRHGDAVLPQVIIKERFGEFAYRPGPGRTIEQDPAWLREHVASASVPLLGEVRCHRAVLPALAGAMRRLAAANLAHTVDRGGYAGCWAPRLVAPGGAMSRHAWGVAVDLNWPRNPVGAASSQDTRLVEEMQRWGFTWGGPWLIPDAAHFEALSPAPRTRG